MAALRWLLLAALMVSIPHPAYTIIEDIVDVLKLTKEIGEGLFSNWKLVAGEDLNMPRDKKLLGAIAQLGRNISSLETLVHTGTTASLSALLHFIPQSTRLELRLNELADLVTRVTTAEAGIRQYAEDPDSVERLTLENFAQWCVSHEPGAVLGLLERIHALVVPDPGSNGLLDRGVLGLLTVALKDANSHLCSLQQSPHQLLYNMYNTIALTEIKGYTMMQFSWMLLKIYGKGNFTRESDLMRQRFKERTTLSLAAVKSALKDASREIWRCDPQYHEEGETFVALTRLLQGYVENEVDMNADNTCRENCAYYNYAKNHGCFKDQFCSRQPPCKGKILNCQYVDSDMWICPAPRSSERRYEWIEYENQRVLGKKGSCLTGTSKVDSWWRLDLFHCSYCLCVCDEPGPTSHRHFSMLPAEADTANNKVVTGLRFTKVNKVIHLQISEGTLLPRGKIDTASIRWKAVTPIDVGSSNLVNGRDYHTMSYEERSIDLDDLEGPVGHLLTGVRLRKVGSHLNFEIRTTPFNFTTGKLLQPKERSAWISNDNTDAADLKPRTRLDLFKPDIPTRSVAGSVPDSRTDQFLEFTHSDLDADAAQSTVPFLDAQAAAPLLAVPLSGAGLFHKGRPHYGGFVTPKVFTYDFSLHMEPVFPVVDDLEDNKFVF